MLLYNKCRKHRERIYSNCLINHVKALSIRHMHSDHPVHHLCVMRRTYLPGCRAKCTKAHPGASFTVEAAFVLPLFLFAILIMLGIFTSLQAQSCMSQALQYSARKTAVSYMDAGDLQKGIPLAAARLIAIRYYQQNGGWSDVIAGGMTGISFLGSDLSGEYVHLCASYKVKLPVSFWGLRSLPVSQCISVRKWIGATEDSGIGADADDGYVYVTEYGTAYHKDLACPYLDLSIRAVSAAGVSKSRNLDGEKYDACSCCDGNESTVYITDYGTEYHSKLSCSHLVRSIHRVEEGSTGGLHACPKCAGGK